MTLSPLLNMKSTNQRASSPQPYATKEMNAYGPSPPMQLMGEPLSTEKQLTLVSYAIVKTPNSLHTWKESPEPTLPQDTRESASQSTSLQQQPLTTDGAATNTTYQCMAGMQDCFDALFQAKQQKRNSFWKKQLQHGNEMFHS
jgi:hypothetical protein